MLTFSLLSITSIVLSVVPNVCGPYGGTHLMARGIIRQIVIKKDPNLYVESWRKAGQGALTRLIQSAKAYEKSGPAHASDPVSKEEGMKIIKNFIDKVAGQKDAYFSGLYWFKDIEKAKKEARNTNKQILSLRLLGNLDDEYSCANSRFFRTVLYANNDIAKFLKENFVLHWKSVRPVPRITIDPGNGKKIDRTITGNSIHYVLDAEGNLMDGIPGLYGPKAFKSALGNVLNFVKGKKSSGWNSKLKKVSQFPNSLQEYHQSRLAILETQWEVDLLRVNRPNFSKGEVLYANEKSGFPSAEHAASRAISKSMVEVTMLKSMGEKATELKKSMSEDLWVKMAKLYEDNSKLDENSKYLIRVKEPFPTQASALVKDSVEGPMIRMVSNFESSIALDTVKNEYLLHSEIHKWLAQGDEMRSVDEFNERVYSELFLTPSQDDWLGLVPGETYSALPGGGLTRK